jgi:hypothetical protein
MLAAPALASAQGHGGMAGGMAGGAGRGGMTQVAMVHGGAWHGGFRGHAGDGHGRFVHDHFFHDRFHDHGLFLGWGPYWGWGWSDCAAYGDACDWGDESGPGDASDDYGYTEGPPVNAACGTWLRHGAGYAWTRRVCGDPPAADPPANAAVASNECGDWVWRADLHRSVCKRSSHAVG